MLEKAWLRFEESGKDEICVEFDFTKNHQYHCKGFEVTHCYNVNGDESIKLLMEATGEYEIIHIKTDNEIDSRDMNMDNLYKFFSNHCRWRLLQVNTSHWTWNLTWMRKEVAV